MFQTPKTNRRHRPRQSWTSGWTWSTGARQISWNQPVSSRTTPTAIDSGDPTRTRRRRGRGQAKWKSTVLASSISQVCYSTHSTRVPCINAKQVQIKNSGTSASNYPPIQTAVNILHNPPIQPDNITSYNLQMSCANNLSWFIVKTISLQEDFTLLKMCNALTK